jgi:hypothetical protein
VSTVSDPERMLWISVFDQVSVFSKGKTGMMERWNRGSLKMISRVLPQISKDDLGVIDR